MAITVKLYSIQEFKNFKKEKVFISCRWISKSIAYEGEGYINKIDDRIFQLLDSCNDLIIHIESDMFDNCVSTDAYWNKEQYLRIMKTKKSKYELINEK